MKIAMLLQGPVANDQRVIRMINTLSAEHEIDLFCLAHEQNTKPTELSPTANVFFIQHPITVRVWLLRHSFFCFEFNHFVKAVLSQNKKYDLIWANDLPMLNPAHILAKKNNAKVVYDSHEIYNESIKHFFPVKSSYFKTIIFNFMLRIMKFHGEKTENKWIRKSALITVNESLLSHFKQKYNIDSGNVVYNFPMLSEKNHETIDFRKILHLNSKDIILLYQGNHNQGRGLFLLLEVISFLPSHYKLICLGEGPLKENLIARAKELKIDHKVHFLSSVPSADLIRYSKGADLGINLLEETNLNTKMASPNKLFEYIHAELPVLASLSIENKKIIQKYGVGVLTTLNVQSIVQVILSLDSHKLAQLKSACAKTKNILTWQNQEQKILQIPLS